MIEELGNALKKILYAGAGIVDIGLEQAEKLGKTLLKQGEALAKRGEDAVNRGKVLNEELKRDMEKAAEEAKEQHESYRSEGQEEAPDMPDVEHMTPEARKALLETLKALEEEA